MTTIMKRASPLFRHIELVSTSATLYFSQMPKSGDVTPCLFRLPHQRSSTENYCEIVSIAPWRRTPRIF